MTPNYAWERTVKAQWLARANTVKSLGLPVPDETYDRLLAKYGLRDANMGCLVDEGSQLLDTYNAAIEKELERRHGKDFWVRFYAELEQLRAVPNKRLQPISRENARSG
jgi:hypothetical protein